MKDVRDDQTAIHAEAAQWLARLNSLPVSRETIEGYFEWRRTPAHADAFEEVESVWRRAGDLPPSPALNAALDAALHRSPASRPRFGYLWGWRLGGRPAWIGAVACLGIVAVLAGAGLWQRGTVYSTGVGEQRLIALDDGSRLRLDTDTRLAVHFSAGARHIDLQHGQAFFSVAHNAARPFTVSAGGTDVVATGTQFDVKAQDGGADVTLVEGRVSVSQPGQDIAHLVAGDQLLSRQNVKPELRHANLSTVTAWTAGHILFEDAPLGQAIDEMNRYLRRPIRLDAPDLVGEHVSGSFDSGDSASFVTALTTTFPLQAASDSDGAIRLSPRTGAHVTK